MTLCDVIKGADHQVGPFSGKTNLKSVYYFNTVQSIEGQGNQYSIYRTLNEGLKQAFTAQNILINNALTDTSTQTAYNRYDVSHLEVIQTYEDFKNAVITGNTAGGRTETLGVYTSPSKAVLMSDLPVRENAATLTPEPAEVQDPCSQTVELTLQKRWKDWGNSDGKRPQTITVTIYQSYEKEGVIHKIPYGEPITLTELENGSVWTDTWIKVVSEAPVAFKEVDDQGTEQLYYYQYTVEEAPVPEYSTEITTSADGFSFTITNTHYGI